MTGAIGAIECCCSCHCSCRAEIAVPNCPGDPSLLELAAAAMTMTMTTSLGSLGVSAWPGVGIGRCCLLMF